MQEPITVNNSKFNKTGFIQMAKKTNQLKPFKKGDERINRNGRPKGSRNRQTIVREWLETVITDTNPLTKQKEQMQLVDFLVLAQIKKALEGNTKSFELLLNSGYGKLLEQYQATNVEEFKLPKESVLHDDQKMLEIAEHIRNNRKSRGVN